MLFFAGISSGNCQKEVSIYCFSKQKMMVIVVTMVNKTVSGCTPVFAAEKMQFPWCDQNGVKCFSLQKWISMGKSRRQAVPEADIAFRRFFFTCLFFACFFLCCSCLFCFFFCSFVCFCPCKKFRFLRPYSIDRLFCLDRLRLCLF